MGARVHLPHEGRKVGTITVEDRRAKFARIQLNGVDVTRGHNGGRVVAACDTEGWVAVLMPSGVIAQHRGDVVITFEPFEGVRPKAKAERHG